MEPLEDRLLLSTYTVANALDSGAGSLRQAIFDANAHPGADVIDFHIGGGGTQTIQPLAELPEITGPVLLDGTTQPDFAGTPIIELDGSLAGATAEGLTISAGNSTVRGLVINRFARSGILLQDAGHNAIEGNYIGTDVTGTVALANGSNGVYIEDRSAENRIGTNGDGLGDEAEGNLISGNHSDGIRLWGRGTDDNVVAGNYIGTDVTGTLALPNGAYGVYIHQGSANRIGTDGDGVADAVEGNLISGNASSGLALDTHTTHTVIAGNLIGTDESGTVALGNGEFGIWIDTAQSTLIGTDGDGVADTEERNVISGNDWTGICLMESMDGSPGNNVIAGNFVGTDVTGSQALGNGGHGVRLWWGASSNLVGTDSDGVADAAEANVISANAWCGVEIGGLPDELMARDNVVAGNFIGTDLTGTVALGNGQHGVWIHHGAPSNRIGTDGDGVADAAQRNVISGNADHGLAIEDLGSDHNVVAGNFIGTDVTGTIALGNGKSGVMIQNRDGGAQHNLIGTDGDGVADEAERNVISANGAHGVAIAGAGTEGNVVAGNYIGTDVTGLLALGNAADGVKIKLGASANRVGTNGDGLADEAERNLISGNTLSGVGIEHAGSDDNVVAGNYIGTDATGSGALGNGTLGLWIWGGPQGNRVGTNGDDLADAAERNVISANAGRGINIGAAGTDFNVVAGNFIGTDFTGTIALGNGSYGVGLKDGARFNRVGTNGDGVADEAERNVISANAADGITICGTGTDENVVAGNFIGTDVTGTVALGNGFGVSWGNGILIDPGPQYNLIGTNGDGIADEAERNLISGNSANGVAISGGGCKHNVVAGNYIGTDVTGMAALGNGFGVEYGHGVWIGYGAQHNLVGTDGDGSGDASERNLISGNQTSGVVITNANTSYNVVAGNYIGTDASGTGPLANGTDGIAIHDWQGPPQHNLIGTDGDGIADEAERNVISANARDGVRLKGAGTDSNVVAGNFIGTDATGTVALGNGRYGVNIQNGPQANLVGTNGDGVADEAERNLISGNANEGVRLQGEGTDENVVAGNLIGTDVTGTAALGNGFGVEWGYGVWIGYGAQYNLVGTDGDGVADTAERNVISANSKHGIVIQTAGADHNVIAGNFIGTDALGTSPLGNGDCGVYIGNWNGAPQHNLIGTNGDGVADEAERNVISGNADEGVVITGEGTDHNVVAGNYIGTDVTGTATLGNGFGVEWGHGVAVLNGASSNLIGTEGDGLADTAERNVISGNNGYGVIISGATIQDTVVAGNFIGTDVTGTAAIGNAKGGLKIHYASNQRIGGSQPGEGNLISGNQRWGVFIQDATATGNLVQGNLIGTDASGTAALGNTGIGLRILHANGTAIGGAAELANTIAFNTAAGVVVEGSSAAGNTIRANSIYANGALGIDLNDDGVTLNDPGDADAGPNHLQNYPLISLVVPGGSTQVVGSLNSAPSSQFTLDFYANTTPDPFGFDEGERWLGSTLVTTDASGDAGFDVVLASATTAGESVTATATDADGNTSEFFPARDHSAEYLRTVMRDGPIAYYRLGEATGAATAVDETGVHHGTYVNDPTLEVPGAILTDPTNTAAAFDPSASQYVEATTLGDFGSRLIHGFTLEYWARFLDDTTHQMILGAANDGYTTDLLVDVGYKGPGSLRLYFRDDDWSRYEAVFYPDGDNVDIYDGAWHHLVHVFDPSTPDPADRVAYYVDGLRQDVPVTLAGGVPDSSSDFVYPMTIGAFNSRGHVRDFFQGDLDEVAFYSRPLAWSEANAHHGVGVGNHVPMAIDDGYYVDENTTLVVPAASGVLANDLDGDADPLEAILVDDPSHGTLALNDDGSFIYTPDAGFRGADRFTYQATDGQADSNVATAWVGVSNDITVNSTADPGDGIPDAAETTLREAIAAANAIPDTQTILFDIPASDPGYDAGTGAYTIQPRFALPEITDPVILDAWTQPGFAGAPIIELDGSQAGTDGLVITTDHSTVRGLVVNRFSGNGIVVDGGSHNAIEGNYIGTDVTGTVGPGNGVFGVWIYDGSQFNRIGTNGDGVADEAERNVISGNLHHGVCISGVGTDQNVVAGNYIGTDASGTAALGNGLGLEWGCGVRIDGGAQSNLVGRDGDGAADAAERNVVSANAAFGVLITGVGTDLNVVAGNFLGTDSSGASALGNGYHGVKIQYGAQRNLVGTDGDGVADEAERNVISGNLSHGLLLQFDNTRENIVAGNFIGTDVTGTAAVPNGLDGVFIAEGAQANLIGTNGDGVADEAERNVISGNASNGISIDGVGTDGNVVAGNFVGTDALGTGALPNVWNGVRIRSGAKGNLVGTDSDGVADEAERNVISGNGSNGLIIIGAGSNENVVAGNFIGTDLTGAEPVPNLAQGVSISWGAAANRIGTNADGQADPHERNVISGNRGHGVSIADSGSSANVVAGNYIGLDVNGAAALGNRLDGVLIFSGASDNTIGGPQPAARNVIAANGSHGVRVQCTLGRSNSVLGNYIGTDATGQIPLGNQSDGIHIADASGNLLGGPGQGNLILGNQGHGVKVVEHDVHIFEWSVGDGGNGHYYVLAPGMRWTTAEEAAVQLGGHLASITTQQEQDFIQNVILAADQFPTEAFWVGFTDQGSEGTFRWTSGEPFDFTNWQPGQPADPHYEDFGAINRYGADPASRGTWSDEPVWYFLRGIIELEAAPDPALLESLFGADDNLLQGNVIAQNGENGVTITGANAAGNRVQANAIHDNGGLGIDLANDGVTANDPGDADTGPNNLQNFPVITAAKFGTVTRVVGTLNSTPNTEFRLDFYANSAADPSGHGEGERWLGWTPVTTDAAGNAAFDAALPSATIFGELITATATDPDGNTSEFSAAADCDTAGPWDPYYDVVMADGPFAYYRLGEAAGETTAVDEIGVHHGTYVNGPALEVPGAILTDPGDTAARFEATQYVEGTTMADFGSRMIDGFTLECWVRLSVPTGGANILGTANPGYTTNVQLSVDELRRMRLYFRDDDWDRYSVWFHTQPDSADLFDQQWHHLVFTYDPAPADPSDRFELFVDSTPQELEVQPGNDRPDGTSDFVYPMILAGWHRRGTVIPTYEGDLDEVAFYTRPLSAAEVGEHYGAGACLHAPVAVSDDDYRVDQNTVLLVSAADGVLANDWDLDGDELAAVLVDRPEHGTLTLRPDGSFRYAPEAGFVGVDTLIYRAFDGRLESNLATATITCDPGPTPDPIPFYFSVRDNDRIGRLRVANEDVIVFDGTRFRLLFDGSDVGLGRLAIDGLAVIGENEILMSFLEPGRVPGIAGTVDNSDLVKFTATGLGPNTAGTFELYFDGSDVGLQVDGENVDGVELLADGRLVFSGATGLRVPGTSGADEDLLAFTPTSLGRNTAGTWARYFDGSDVGLGIEDVNAVSQDDRDNLLFSCTWAFALPEVAGRNEDVFLFRPTSLGPVTAGTFALALYFDGSHHGLGRNAIEAIDLAPNYAPVADDDGYDAVWNQVLNVPAAHGVLANDWDPDGDPLTAVLVDGPEHGTIVLGCDGSFTYLPDEGFLGVDQVTYVARDGRRGSNVATLTIEVVTHPPIAVDDSYSMRPGGTLTVGQSGAEPIEVFFDDFEDGPSASWSKTTTSVTPIGSRAFLGRFAGESVVLALDGLPTHGELIVEFDLYIIQTWDGNDLVYGYGPDVWSLGLEGEEPAVTTTFTNVSWLRQAYPDSYPGGDHPPQAGAVEVNTLGYSNYGDSVYHIQCALEHAQSSVRLRFAASGLQDLGDESWGLDNVRVSVVPTGVLVNDYDPDGDPLTAGIATDPEHGTAELDPNGSFVYQPDPGFVGLDRFTYVANDGLRDSSPATVTIEVGDDLGAVDFLALDGLDPSTGDLWCWLDTTRDGYLTLEASFEGPIDSVQLTLCDENLMELATCTPVGANRRIDWQTDQGQTYYLKMSGQSTDVDLRLANLVQHAGAEVTVYGTDGDDEFEFDAAASRLVTVNGVEYHFDDAEVASVTFDGGPGIDGFAFRGSAADEWIKLGPDRARVTGPDYRVSTTSTENATAQGNGGVDVAQLFDSLGADVFDASDRWGRMSGPGYENEADDVFYVHGYASDDGQIDRARVDGSVGDPDLFRAWPSQACLQGAGSYGYYTRARGFDEVEARLTDPDDVTVIYDSPGPDVFDGYADRAVMTYADGKTVRVDDCRWMHAHASPGAVDTANLYDTTADGLTSYNVSLEARVLDDGRHLSRMFTAEYLFQNRVLGFEATRAVCEPGGNDGAWLFDSTGADQFEAYADRGTLTYEDGTVVEARNFRYLHAFARNGGLDTAILHDQTTTGTSLATTLYGYATSALLYTGHHSGLVRAWDFDQTRAALGGGDDYVRLYDDPGLVDRLVVPFPGDAGQAPAKAKLSNDARQLYIDDFARLWAATSEDFEDEAEVDPAYADQVILEGNWVEL